MQMENEINKGVTNVDKEFEVKLNELLELEFKVKGETVAKVSEAYETKKKEITTKASHIKQGLKGYFNELQKFIGDRLQAQERKVETIRSELIERLDKKKKDVEDKVSDVLENVTSFTGQSSTQQKDTNMLNQCIDLIRKLNGIQEMPNQELPDWSIHVSQACTAEDVKSLISVLGTVSEKHTDRDNQCPRLQKELKYLVETYRSMNVDQNGKLDGTVTALRGELHTTQSIRPTGPDAKAYSNPITVTKSDVPTMKLMVLQAAAIKELLQGILQTWELAGDWSASDGVLKVYSNSKLNAERCMRVLLEAVQSENIELREEYDMVVETDKWAEFTARIRRQNPNKVWIHCDKQRDTIINICSICSLTLNNVADMVKRFLRDNQVLKFKLKYTAEAVNIYKKHKKWINKIQSRYSEFGVFVTFNTESDDEIRVQGTGIGVARAVRDVNNTVNRSELSKDNDDDRFSNDDEEERFSDDDGDSKKTSPRTKSDTICPSMILSAGQSDTQISAVCFTGDDTIIYVVTGDIMSLPVEAIVNPANRLLKHDGGLAKALCEKGGRIIQEQCYTYVHGLDNRAVPAGGVFCSSAGDLPLRAILHTVSKKWEGDGQSTMAILREAVKNTLQIATVNMIQIIAVPAIGTGAYKVPIDLSTDAIVETIKEFWYDNPMPGKVREVYLCDRGMEATQAFVTAVKKHIPDVPILTGCFPPSTAAIERPILSARRAQPFLL